MAYISKASIEKVKKKSNKHKEVVANYGVFITENGEN